MTTITGTPTVQSVPKNMQKKCQKTWFLTPPERPGRPRGSKIIRGTTSEGPQTFGENHTFQNKYMDRAAKTMYFEPLCILGAIGTEFCKMHSRINFPPLPRPGKQPTGAKHAPTANHPPSMLKWSPIESGEDKTIDFWGNDKGNVLRNRIPQLALFQPRSCALRAQHPHETSRRYASV